jgi:two-component system CheB/CheR fusion protein
MIDGPGCRIERSCLSPLALMLHEWATNSVKYGALGSAGGKLSITWMVDAEGLALRWRETGDRPVTLSDGAGFGTVLVDTSSRQLGAAVKRTVEDHDFIIDIHLPPKVLSDD